MIPGQREYFLIFFFIYLLFTSQFAISQPSGNRDVIAGVSTLWINRPSIGSRLNRGILNYTPILLEGNASLQFLYGFSCNFDHAKCFLGISLVFYNTTGETIYIEGGELVWSANRDRPVQVNATLELGRDGNLVLADFDGTPVWSTNTTGKYVSALKLTDMGNLVLFDTTNRTIWQSFDHPTNCLLPGQNLVSGEKLTASVSADNSSQGLLSLTILNGHLATYINSDPPQYYYASDNPDSRYYSFDGQTLTALQYPPTSIAQYIKLGHDGHLRVYQLGDLETNMLGRLNWKEVDDILTTSDCGYPMVCGRYSICTNGVQCSCPVEGNFFRPFSERNPDLGCTEMTPISCDSSQYHSLVELKNTKYFAFLFNHKLTSGVFWLEGKKIEDCKRACLSNCSCKAAVFEQDYNVNQRGNCLLLNEVFSLMDSGVGSDKTIFLKVQNSSNAPVISPRQKTKPFRVIIGCTLIGIILILSVCSALSKKRSQKSKTGDFLDLEPILPGILTRFSYNELKIITEDFSRKLGEGGFGSVYEGTLRNGTKIAVKHLDGVGQVKESFLTEVKTVGGIHHINLVKLIGFCAEKNHRLLIYEYMVNGSLDRWITHENQENGLTWNTRQRIISDIAKGLAYLHEDCSHKIIHLDIKPQNILLDQYFNAKISDFGLSKLIEKDISKVVTRMRGTPGYLAPEWLSSVITEKVDVYAFGIVLLEILCGRKNLDWSQADEEDAHLLSVFTRKAEQEELMDIVDKNNKDMQLHREAVVEMMSLAAWCLQGDFSKRPSMSLVVKVLEGLVTAETNLDYNFRNVPKVGAGNQQRDATISSKLPSVLSGPR
ncbi:G-type lectin S-receptor-like serine/threonine-protein kinase SD2-5 [Solanum dulcamara]|uniref:G-type lectin S-receptor-like serine/threonine-protein kinase SD2-5 n=1 Tax=Solanum dulcamara TaxID=45834 RepID=UPI002484F55C|nr:G-type lectin S-receptor-like serine/threonine-protein kinase SD2-5 [Solanum dulcamara]